ncbi:MAG: DNA methyltransferase [Promethearchaeota archaeon]
MIEKNNHLEDFKHKDFECFYSSIQKKDKNLLDEHISLKIFFDFLTKNKINFKILKEKSESYIVLKILSIESALFYIPLNKNDIKNYLVSIDDLYYLTEKFLNNSKESSKFFILFLESNNLFPNNILSNIKYVDIKKIPLEKNNKKIDDNINKISVKKILLEGFPLGVYNKKNKLNELTGKEWIKFTKSWFIHNPPPRNKSEILHPAKFPESLIEKFILFFTKKGQLVLDPFVGIGSTAVAAKNIGRSCIGIEINEKYVSIARKRLAQRNIDEFFDINENKLKYLIFHNDSNNIEKIWEENNLPLADFCITSPPYWNQLKRNFMRQLARKDQGLDTKYSDLKNDIGNIDDYNEFIKAQKRIFNKIYNVLKDGSYLVIITNNIFYNGRLYPLAFDTAISLSDKWVLKDEKIWCQNDKALLPLGINNAWIANRCHQYCLIFRKEEKV